VEGNPSLRILPYRELQPWDLGCDHDHDDADKDRSNQRKLLCDWKRVFCILEDAWLDQHPDAVFRNLAPTAVKAIYDATVSNIPRPQFSSAVDKNGKQKIQRMRRPEFIKVSTVVKYIRAEEARLQATGKAAQVTLTEAAPILRVRVRVGGGEAAT